MSFSHFPEKFIWGVAASSYQLEGAAYDDGKGASVWDEFCKQPGAIKGGDTGDVSCDHYHRFPEDVSIMSHLGYPAYRLSINWPRVLPDGVGRLNAKGLDFYDRLIDAMLEKNIDPHVTLFHWDYPQALQDRGGWLNPDSPKWFAEYTRVIIDRLSDRVHNWMTFNEPQCFILLGHLLGVHAPGLKLPVENILTAIHNFFLSHGESVGVIRENARTKPNIGVAMIGASVIPETDSPESVEQARQHIFTNPVGERALWNASLWFDPMLLGRYPEGFLESLGDKAPRIGPRDMEIIARPLDFLGLNIYWAPQIGHVTGAGPGTEAYADIKGMPRTNIGWPVTPKSLYWGPRFYHERYGLPVYITENGLANQDWISLDGKVHDPQRIDFLKRYLLELDRAIADGVDIRAYMQWSVFDNFEWAEGYDKRFGLVYVDYQTQKRTIKDSAYWYSRVIETNGQSLYTE